jgi:rhodanese-related sulfurtransferase
MKNKLAFSTKRIEFSFIHHEKVLKNFKNFTFIDVRSTQEYNQGHVRNAFNLPWTLFQKASHLSDLLSTLKNVEGLLPFPSSQLVFYCQLSLIRSPGCLHILSDLVQRERNQDLKKEFQQVQLYLLVGGYKQWSTIYGKQSEYNTSVD